MTEEETWIKEKEQILSSEEIGHDLTTVHLLISKNKVKLQELKFYIKINKISKMIFDDIFKKKSV